MGAPSHVAEDLAQDVFIRLFRVMERYNDERPIRGFIFGVTRNVWREYRKSAIVRYERVGSQSDVAQSDARPSDPAPSIEAADTVYAALNTLSAPQREIFVLGEMEGYAMPEIADLLDINIDTGYSRLRKARLAFTDAVIALQSQNNTAATSFDTRRRA